MNEQEKIKKDEINFQADTLTDLPVTDKHAEATRGGRRGGADDLNAWQSNYGVGA
jgi:hypothetical protein